MLLLLKVPPGRHPAGGLPIGRSNSALRVQNKNPPQRGRIFILKAPPGRHPASGLPIGRSDSALRVQNKDPPQRGRIFILEAPPGIGPGIKVLQTSALPLGYGAVPQCLISISQERRFVNRNFHLSENFSPRIQPVNPRGGNRPFSVLSRFSALAKFPSVNNPSPLMPCPENRICCSLGSRSSFFSKNIS